VEDARRERRRLYAKERRRWLVRAAVLVNLALVGSVAVRGRPASVWYYAGGGEAATSLGKGLLVGLAVFLVIAAIGLAVKRREVAGRWGEVAFGRPVLIVTFALLLAAAGSRVARREEQVASAIPNVHGSEVQRERARRDAMDWSKQLTPIPDDSTAAFHDIRVVDSILKRGGNNAHARALNRDARRRFERIDEVLRTIPDYPESDLNGLRDSLIEIVALRRHAAVLYVRALESNARRGTPLTQDKRAMAMLLRGDHLLKLSERRGVRFVGRVKLVAKRYSLPG
jgi:hypothetical protein